MITFFAIDFLVVLVVAIIYTGQLEREEARRARRANLPTIGADVSVPRAVAIPSAVRRADPLRWPR